MEESHKPPIYHYMPAPVAVDPTIPTLACLATLSFPSPDRQTTIRGMSAISRNSYSSSKSNHRDAALVLAYDKRTVRQVEIINTKNGTNGPVKISDVPIKDSQVETPSILRCWLRFTLGAGVPNLISWKTGDPEERRHPRARVVPRSAPGRQLKSRDRDGLSRKYGAKVRSMQARLKN